MKKIISKILALVMFVGTILPVNNLQVYAANVNLEPSMDRSLTVGSINDIPIDKFENISDDEVFLSWDVSTRVSGFYRLKYPIDNNKVASLILKRSGQDMTVAFEVDKPTIGEPSYFVHSSENSGGNERFVPYKDYITLHNPSGQINYVVDVATPTFSIRQDHGFSFQYENHTMHFKWEGNKFLFVTNRINPGYIYPFTLESGDTLNTLGNPSTRNILTGLDQSLINITPIANTDKTIDDIIDMTGAVPDEHPGSPDVRMGIEFSIPLEWDPAKRLFTDISSIQKLPVTINFGNIDHSKTIQMIFDDVLLANPAVNLTLRPLGAFLVNNAVNKSGNKVSFVLGGLDPSLIYHESYFSIPYPDSNVLMSKNTFLPFGKVYTFIEYKVIVEDGRYSIQAAPYKGFSGYYRLISGLPVGGSYVELQNSGNKPLDFPLTLNENNQRIEQYQILFSPEVPFPNVIDQNTPGIIRSQILRYSAHPPTFEIGRAKGLEVLNPILIEKNTSVNGEEAFLDMTLRWTIASKTIIDHLVLNSTNTPNSLVIEYAAEKSLTPNINNTIDFANIKLTITSGAGITTGPGLAVEYTDSQGKVVGGQVGQLVTVLDPSTGGLSYQARVDLRVDAARNGTVASAHADFIYPNIYFLSIRPIRQNGVDINVSSSTQANLTLSDISRPKVPPPQNVNAYDPITKSVINGDDKDEISFKLRFDLAGQEIKKYLNSVDEFPNGDIDIKMNMYISQNEEYMRNTFHSYDLSDRRANSVLTQYKEEYQNSLYFSAINGMMPMISSGYSSPLHALRDNKVVRIDNISLTKENFEAILNGSTVAFEYLLDGLDKNQRYYVYLDTVITHFDDLGNKKIESESMVSNLVSITTKSDFDIPTGQDRVPPAPVLNKEFTDSNDAIIYWDQIPAITDEEIIEYEIIRLDARQMDNRLLDDRSGFADFWNIYLKDFTKTGIRTNNSLLQQFNGSSFVHADINRFNYNLTNTAAYFTDRTTSSNEIYFYYVRTVKKIGDKELYSVWSAISFTTIPVQKPINLLVESHRNDYDPNNEIIISFDAPITDLAELGSKYNIQYQLREAGQSWGQFINMNSNTLRSNASNSPINGYTHFEYKIGGLKSSTSYTVRIRMITSEGDASDFSNEVGFRTEVNQSDYDKEQGIADWLKYIREQLMLLIKDPYWVINPDSSTFEVIYRPNMFNQVMDQSVGQQIELVGTDQSTAIYYLPASILIAANSNNKGFKVTHENMEFIISPDSISQDNNHILRRITEDMKKDNLSDYYIRLTLRWHNTNAFIEGNDALSKELEVRIDAVGTDKNIAQWDDKILSDTISEILLELGDEERLRNLISRNLDRKVLSEEMISVIDKLVNDVRTRLMRNIVRELNSISRLHLQINNLDNPLIVVINGLDSNASVKGFIWEAGIWSPIDIVNFGLNKAIYSNKTGTFVFTGKVIVINGIQNVENGGTIVSLISKYSLDDFFGKGNNLSLEANATRNMLINSVARIAGAPNTVNAADWLNANTSSNISSRNMNGNLSTEEAVSLVMTLYEAKTNTDTSTVKITNYANIGQITGISDRYRNQIMLAFEVGIYNNKQMQPSQPIKVKEVLELLKNLDLKVKL